LFRGHVLIIPSNHLLSKLRMPLTPKRGVSTFMFYAEMFYSSFSACIISDTTPNQQRIAWSTERSAVEEKLKHLDMLIFLQAKVETRCIMYICLPLPTSAQIFFVSTFDFCCFFLPFIFNLLL